MPPLKSSGGNATSRLAIRNLLQDRTRLVVSVVGLGLALALVLFFDAVFTGATSRLTVYIDKAGADVWVSQQGVETMHMSSSALPAATTEQVKAVPGVEEAVPVLYATDLIRANGKEYIAYVFGVPEGAPLGRAPGAVDGATLPGPGEIIIDHAVAAKAGLGIGDQVTVLGQQLRIAGLTAGTSTLASSISIVRLDDFARARGGGEVISFVLVKASPGEAPAALADRIRERVGGVNVQTREQFAAQERKLVKDMSADILNIMNTAGLLTGFAVVALTVYIATIARRREYGVLKAIGVRNRTLYGIVVLQAVISVAMGLAAGTAITLALAEVIPRFDESLVLSLRTAALARAAVASLFIAGAAALLPARQIAGLEPVTILRRR